jgi:hypothetical protein
VPIRRTCRTHASWQIAISLAVLMLMLAIAVASAHYQSSLSDPQVSPRETTAGDPVNFSVDFTDETGAAPRSVQVQIDDSVRAMAASSGDYRNGVRFSLSIPVPVGSHAISFIAIPAQGDRQFEPAGAVTVHPASVTPSPSPNPSPSLSQPTPTQSPSAISPTQAPASQSPEPTSETASGRDGSPVPESSPKADPSAGLTGMTPVGPVTTPTQPTATPAARGATSSQGAAANGEPASGDPPSSGTGDVPENGGGQSVDGAEGSTGFGGTSGHGPGLIEAARGSSGTGNTRGVPSYLLVNYHAPLSQLIVALAPSISTAAGGTAAWAAFVLFGKRRRNGAAADPESALATAAATGLEIGAGQGLTTVDESLMPRWRRPSLQQARRTDPLRAVAEASSLSFAASGLQTGEDYERRQIRYRLVRLLDRPDELRSAEIGVVDRGDEVLLLERRGVYWLVLCPDGRQGWVHRMTLSDPARDDAPEVVPWEDPAIAAYASTDYVPAESVPAEASAPDSEPADPGFLEAYMQARNDGLRSMADTQAEPPAEPAAEAVASDLPAAAPSVASRAPVAEPSTDAAPAGEPGCAGERCSGRKSAGNRKAATGSRPGARPRRP